MAAASIFSELPGIIPDPSELLTVEAVKTALVRLGRPLPPGRLIRFYAPHTSPLLGFCHAGPPPVIWLRGGQAVDELKHTLIHEAGHLLVARGGSAEAEEQAERFARQMLAMLGWRG